MDFTTLSGEALTAALPTDVESMDAAALTAAVTDIRAGLDPILALSAATVAQVNDGEALSAALGTVEAEQARREEVKKDAAKRFGALKATFASSDEKDKEAKSEADAEADDVKKDDKAKPKPFSVDDETVEAEEPEVEESEEDAETEGDEGDESDAEAETEGEGDTVTASAKPKAKGSAARKVASRTTRPAAKQADPITITASADVPNFSMGSQMGSMAEVTKGLIARAKGFAPHNARAAAMVNEQSGGEPVLNKVGLASIGLNFDKSLVAATEGNGDYNAVRNSLKRHEEVVTASMGGDDTLTAAGWCAPSQPVYSYLSDYVVDGMLTLPEVSAPRGGLLITTGPQKGSQGQALDDFGWTQTEAQAEAGQVKPCEVIECPDFVDHRLDAVGYCYKIPILTKKAYPELVEDALKYASVLYAHRMNRRFISDIVALSDTVGFNGYGPSTTDTLEALSIIAVKERRKWDVGVNAIMQVKIPVWVQEVFRADMSRRAGRALSDVATDALIAAEFSARRLAVEYVSDWQELGGENAVLRPTFDVLIFPLGTFVKAVEDVISLQAVYDAASLSVNEYTGVFFEQGIMTAKVGYGSRKVTIRTNTAGEQGSYSLVGPGDKSSLGSF